MPEKITRHLHNNPTNGEVTYSIDSLKSEFTVIDVGHVGWIAFNEKGILMDFYIFSFVSSDLDGLNSEGSLIWYGQGFTGNLKELRHSYFTEYAFYINLELMGFSVDWLKSHFED